VAAILVAKELWETALQKMAPYMASLRILRTNHQPNEEGLMSLACQSRLKHFSFEYQLDLSLESTFLFAGG
jgi:hypothetical protein